MRAERAVPAGGLFPMETSAQSKYREFAEECERLAKQAAAERHRAVLLEMAAAWRQLSEARTKEP